MAKIAWGAPVASLTSNARKWHPTPGTGYSLITCDFWEQYYSLGKTPLFKLPIKFVFAFFFTDCVYVHGWKP